MATSGSYSFNLTKLQILQRALQMINIYDVNSPVDNDDLTFASDILNLMLKSWEVEGIRLWKRRQATLFTQSGQNSYQIGSVSGADHVTNSYVSTTINSAVSEGDSTVVCASVTGMSVDDNIGIELDSGTRQWFTISAINTSTKTVTLSGTVDSAASTSNTVVTYTSKINRPLEIIQATCLDLKNSNSATSMMDLSFDEYFNLPIKTSSGQRFNNYYYDRLLNNTLPYTGTLYLFPQPSAVWVILNFIYYDEIQDMVNNSDSPDFPQEWLYAIITNLAVELAAFGYGKLTELAPLQQKALQLKQELLNFDNDDSSLKISLDQLRHNEN